MSRPTVYNAEEHPLVAEKMASMGATIAEIAEVVGVSGTTVKNWMQAHPVFLASVKAGRDAAVDRVEKALFERAIGYSWPSEKLMTVSDAGGGSHVERLPIIEHAPPDPACIKFFLANRRRREWAERTQIEGGDGGPLVVRVIRAANAPGTLAPQIMDKDPA